MNSGSGACRTYYARAWEGVIKFDRKATKMVKEIVANIHNNV